MTTRSGFECYAVKFDRDVKPTADTEVDALLARLKAGDVTDLLVLSHGWRNDELDAATLYGNLLACQRQEMDRPAAGANRDALSADRKFVVAEIYWPSKKSADAANIPGGAAGVDDPAQDAAQARAFVDEFATLFGPEAGPQINELRALVPRLDAEEAARGRFLEIVRALTPAASEDTFDMESEFHTRDAEAIWQSLGPDATDQPVAEGGAAGLGDFFGGIVHQVRDMLDIATFYTMKERSGQAGIQGVNPVLRSIRAQCGAQFRIHLGGHSFGGRLVTAALLGAAGDPPVVVQTLALLQAAYSHFGLSENYNDSQPPQPGFFNPVRRRNQVTGATVITHSKNDQAVGMAYPVAARLADQEAADIGDANSPFGGMGRNGAQKTALTNFWTLGPPSTVYAFQPGQIFNLCGDGTPGQPGVIESHGDVAKPEIAHAWVAAIAKT